MGIHGTAKEKVKDSFVITVELQIIIVCPTENAMYVVNPVGEDNVGHVIAVLNMSVKVND